MCRQVRRQVPGRAGVTGRAAAGLAACRRPPVPRTGEAVRPATAGARTPRPASRSTSWSSGGGITGAGRGPGRGQPGAQDRPGGEGRLRLGHLVQVVQAGPRRAPLPAAERVPPGLREPGRAPAPARQRPPPGDARSPSSSPCSDGTGVVNRSVARVYRTALWLYDLTGGVRIGRRHEKVTRDAGPGPHAQPPGRPAGRPASSTGTPAPTTPGSPSPCSAPPCSTTARWPPTTRRSTALTTGPTVGSTEPPVAPDGGEPLRRPRRGGGQRRPASGPTRSAPSTSTGTRTRSGRPRASTSPCPGPPSRATSPPSSRSARTTGRSSWCPGGDQVYLGHHRHRVGRTPRRPELPPRGRRLHPRRGQRHDHPPARRATTSPASGPGFGRCWPPIERGARPSERTADLSRRHTVRTSPEGMVTVTGGKLTTYRKMAEDTVDAALGSSGARGSRASPRRSAPGRAARRPRARAPIAAGAGVGTPPAAEPPPRAAHLAGRYGTETPACWPWPTDGPSCSTRWSPASPTWPPRPSTPSSDEMARLRGRRARPAHPGRPPRRPGAAAAAARGGRAHRPAARLGRPAAPSRGRGGTPVESAADLARAGLDPETAGPVTDGRRAPTTAPAGPR